MQITQIYETIQGWDRVHFSILPEARSLCVGNITWVRQDHPQETASHHASLMEARIDELHRGKSTPQA